MAVAPPRALTLEELQFSNSFTRLPAHLFEARTPDGLTDPRLVALSEPAGALLDLPRSELLRDEFRRIAGGTAILRAMQPIAALYGGHQFGVWAGQLGDGRAITLGEVTNRHGEPWEIQLKGAGRTAYSRFADGRAVLRSTIREFLASEAMDALGIPTTRALAMTASADPVARETLETAAVLVRLAPSFVRFGSFEILAARDDAATTRVLADYVIDRFYRSSDLGSGSGDDRYAQFFTQVVERTAGLMADWQSVGFMHGVMNTDNFSILGLTLDYGPYGFMEAYEPGHICNHTDEGGRYAFDRQPAVALWNLVMLANALTTLLEPAALEEILATYAPRFRAAYLARMRAKLGLEQTLDGDDELAAELRTAMAAVRADFTRSFRLLADIRTDAESGRAELLATLGNTEPARVWLGRYLDRLTRETRPAAERAAAQRRTNPRIVLRNHLAQEAIVAAQGGDDVPVQRLLAVLRRPYDDDPEVAAYDRPAPPNEPPVEVSCSS